MKFPRLLLTCSRFTAAFAMLAALLTHLTAPSAFAATYYWDNDGATAGFGTAAGTWAVPTIGDSTQGWSTNGTGGTLPVNVTTTTSDPVNFGNGATGLGAGLSFRTPAGLFQFVYSVGKSAYAKQAFELRTSKIHFGLTSRF